MISIVLPVYNGEKYLALSIESVLAQTYTDWELIIVNDCSTDSSLAIAEQYAKKDSRIRIINNPENKRVARSLNIGFAQAKGEYYTWTSDDNIYQSHALATMAAYLDQKKEAYFVYTDMNYIDENGVVMSNSSHTCQNIYLRCCVGACFLYRKEVAEEIGGYNPKILYVDDYEYWIRISMKYELHHIPEICYQYRIHHGAMTYTHDREMREITAQLKMSYLEEIYQRTSEADFKVFCTTCLLYDPRVESQIRDIVNQKGLTYDAKMRCHRQKPDKDKPYIIFGAGMIGAEVRDRIGTDKVAYFADNRLGGTKKDNIPVLSFEELVTKAKDYNVVIAAGYLNSAQIIEQFIENGITNYMIYQWLKDEDYDEKSGIKK